MSARYRRRRPGRFLTWPPGSCQLPCGPSTCWYAASYTRTTASGGFGHLSSLSCCLSAAAVRFLAVLSRRGVKAFLAVGLPAVGHVRRTGTGFPCSAPVRYGQCRALPIPRGRGAHVADIETSTTTVAFQRRALYSGSCHHPPEVLGNEAYGSSLSFALIWSSSCLWPVDGSPGPWAISRASHPAVTSDACQE